MSLNPHNAFNGRWIADFAPPPGDWHTGAIPAASPFWVVLELPAAVAVSGLSIWSNNHTLNNRQPLKFSVFGGPSGTNGASDSGWTLLRAFNITSADYFFPAGTLQGSSSVNYNVTTLSSYPGLTLKPGAGAYEVDNLSLFRCDLSSTSGQTFSAYRLVIYTASGDKTWTYPK